MSLLAMKIIAAAAESADLGDGRGHRHPGCPRVVLETTEGDGEASSPTDGKEIEACLCVIRREECKNRGACRRKEQRVERGWTCRHVESRGISWGDKSASLAESENTPALRVRNELGKGPTPPTSVRGWFEEEGLAVWE